MGQLDVVRGLGICVDLHCAPVEVDGQAAVLASREHDSHGAVHHVQLVVVLRLDHLVAGVEAWPPSGLDIGYRHPVELQLQEPLQLDVEFHGAQRPLVDGRQHLHIPQQVEAEAIDLAAGSGMVSVWLKTTFRCDLMLPTIQPGAGQEGDVAPGQEPEGDGPQAGAGVEPGQVGFRPEQGGRHPEQEGAQHEVEHRLIQSRE